MLNQAENKGIRIKAGRLKKRPEFLCVASDGKKWVSDTMVVQALETDTDAIRFGFTATKKIGNAVIRNRAKRRLRAAADETIKAHQLKSTDIVLIARHACADADWDKLLKDLAWCLRRLDLMAS